MYQNNCFSFFLNFTQGGVILPGEEVPTLLILSGILFIHSHKLDLSHSTYQYA